MRDIIKNTSNTLLAFMLCMALLFPLAFEAMHVTNEHEHVTCNDFNTTHFHEKDISCQLLKVKPTNEVVLHTTVNNTLDQPLIITHNFNYYLFVSEFQQLHFSLRGPPHFS